jgi:hypothetical protein
MRRLFLALAGVAACGGGAATSGGPIEGGARDGSGTESGASTDATAETTTDATADASIEAGPEGGLDDAQPLDSADTNADANADENRCDPAAMPRPDPNAGNVTEQPGTGGCPPGMIAVSTFCIDKYEATLVRADTGATWCPFDNPGTTAVRAISVANAVPQAYISGVQAAAACASAGKRLCTEAEWLRACQGPGGTTYPYGNTDAVGVCNDHRTEHPAVEYFGTTDAAIYTMLGNACLDQLPQTVEPSGSLAGCVTAEGAYDMMGNLEEWTANPSGAFRGGYYVDTVQNGPGCLYVTTAHTTSYWDYSTGFRCCAD